MPGRQSSFNVNGDEINGWWWLRDSAGVQKASWELYGEPTADEITLNIEVLATDKVNGGPDVDARFWISYEVIVSADSPSSLGAPQLVELPNTSPVGDPVGYTATGSTTIHRSDIPAGAIGVRIEIGRVGPDGTVVSEHIAVREASLRITGITGSEATTAPSGSATTAPSGSGAYGPITITNGCATDPAQLADFPVGIFTVTGSAAPDPHFEISKNASFSIVLSDVSWVLSSPAYSFSTRYLPDKFPDGIWVRWTSAPSITAHAPNGPCAGATPRPSLAPTADSGSLDDLWE